MNEETCLDLATLEKLRKLGGGEFVVQIINLFFAYVPTKLAEARAGEQTGDLVAIQRAVHPIKSSAANVGAIIVRDIATQIEQLAIEKKQDSIPLLLSELEMAYSQVKVQLERQEEAELRNSKA